MFTHPLLKALLDENASDPSKQLAQVRVQLRDSTLHNPTILLILPPAELIEAEIEVQYLYHDYFLLSHVVDVSKICQEEPFETLNGSHWKLQLTSTQIVPDKGFPANGSQSVKILDSYVWSPGLKSLPYNASFLVAEVDSLLVNNDAPKRFAWFNNNSRSTPQAEDNSNATTRSDPALNSGTTGLDPTKDGRSPPSASRLRNPASELGRTKAQRETNMAKVDYALACLQQDVATSSELAERFHRAVTSVRSVLIEAGGLYIESTDRELSGDDGTESLSSQETAAGSAQELPKTAFTLASVYRYAEAKLGKYLLKQLGHLLEVERQDTPSFYTLYTELNNLDIAQVDIPSFDPLKTTVFEQAIYDASLILGRLTHAQNSYDMCNVFLAALKRLATPALGTISADTLLGLFMLTVLRVSEDTARQLELDLYFVMRFSFQASDTVAMRAKSGRVAYTLMVVESVLVQLRMERDRLSKLSDFNKAMWQAVRADDREAVKSVAEGCMSSLRSRRNGKSVLFMAVEDQNTPLLEFLLSTFPDVFTQEFVLSDRDLENRTLLMVAVSTSKQLSSMIFEYISKDSIPAEKVNAYCNALDINFRSAAYYLIPSETLDLIGSRLNWAVRDVEGNTPIIHHIIKDLNSLPFVLKFCRNFYNHIDNQGNCLLHYATQLDDASLVETCLALDSCDVNWVNNEAETPLMLSKSDQVSHLLLTRGADAWLGRLKPDMDPILRASRVPKDTFYIALGQKTSGTELLVFHPPETLKGVNRSAEDFVALGSALHSLSQNSWVPPLRYTYPERLLQTGFASRFYPDRVELETLQMGFWLRQLSVHATFKDIPEFQGFYAAPLAKSPAAAEEQENVALAITRPGNSSANSTLFGQEDEKSMLAFLELGSNRLKDVECALGVAIRQLSRVHTLETEETRLQWRFNRKLRNLSRSSYTSHFYTVLREPPKPVHSLAVTALTSTLDTLATYARDLSRKLLLPLNMAEQLEYTRQEFQAARERLRTIAEGTAKITSWIGNSEEKRLAEIKQLEAGIASDRLNIKSLETDIRASHYFLANELSTFNQSQEAEVLNFVEQYSSYQLQKNRTNLIRLKHGTSSSRPKQSTV